MCVTHQRKRKYRVRPWLYPSRAVVSSLGSHVVSWICDVRVRYCLSLRHRSGGSDGIAGRLWTLLRSTVFWLDLVVKRSKRHLKSASSFSTRLVLWLKSVSQRSLMLSFMSFFTEPLPEWGSTLLVVIGIVHYVSETLVWIRPEAPSVVPSFMNKKLTKPGCTPSRDLLEILRRTWMYRGSVTSTKG